MTVVNDTRSLLIPRKDNSNADDQNLSKYSGQVSELILLFRMSWLTTPKKSVHDYNSKDRFHTIGRMKRSYFGGFLVNPSPT